MVGVPEGQAGDLDLPPAWGDIALQAVAAFGVQDLVGAVQVRVGADDALPVVGQRADHVADLLGILVDHDGGADHDGGPLAPQQPDIERHQTDAEEVADKVERAPLGLVDQDAAPDRGEHLVQPAGQRHPHGVLKAERHDGGDVAQAVHQFGGIAALRPVLGVGQPRHGAVEMVQDEAQDGVADHGDGAGDAGDGAQGHDRPDQADDALEIEELVLREVEQRRVGLADPLDRLARVVGFMPPHGERHQLAVQHIHEALADAERREPLDDAAGTVQRPAEDAEAQHPQHVDAGLGHAVVAALLEVVDGVAEEIRNRQPRRLRRDEQEDEGDDKVPAALGVAPESAIKLAQPNAGGGTLLSSHIR